ncbi:MAG: hypothetical protein HY962_00790 [Ignavibacteriae bacterium]|nr:hypothetical protein [Ignavibacteriota bacterium]
MKYRLLLVLFFLFPVGVIAQMEHVPATHPVYDYLDRLASTSRLKGFSRAVLPMERRTVVEFLEAAAKYRTSMSETEARLFDRYRDEFVAEADRSQNPTVFFQDGTEGLVSDREKFLYRWISPDNDTRFFMEFLGSADARVQDADGKSSRVVLGQVGGRFRGTAGGTVGFGLQATNGMVFGDTAFARSDAALRKNSNFGEWGNQYFDFSEAYLGVGWSWGDASLGRERVLIGGAHGDRVTLGMGAPVFDALRLNARAGNFRFMYIHGFILAEKQLIEVFRPYYESKYFVYHRAEADLFESVRFGVYESVIYSQRQIDPGYLIPVNFFKSAEHAGGDRDNPMLGFDLQSLSLPGIELFGSWTIDDIDMAKFGSGWWGNKFIWQAGAVTHSLGDTRIGLEYTRIEPYVYSHAMRDNEYTHKGVALGLELPPNSDEWYTHVTWWYGASLSLGASLRVRRHGANEYGGDGSLRANHGGSVTERFVFGRDNETAPFLGGVRETRKILTLNCRYEPIRNIAFDAAIRFTKVEDRQGTHNTGYGSLQLEIAY